MRAGDYQRARWRAAALVALALLGGALVLQVGRNAYALWRSRHELADLEYAHRRLAAEHAALEQRVADLTAPEGIEGALRRMGYVRPGERPIRFVEPPPPDPALVPAPWPVRVQEATRIILQQRFGRGGD